MIGQLADGRRQRKKRAVRDSIVGAAALLFVERGFDETRMDAISDAADIAVGTVYNYFKTKTDLLVAILLDDVDAFVLETRTLVAHPDRDTVVAIVALCNALIGRIDRRPRSLWRQLFGHALIDSALLGPTYAGVERLLLNIVRTVLQKQQNDGLLDARLNVEDASNIVFGLANTLIYTYCRTDDMAAEDFAQALTRQLRVVFATSANDAVRVPVPLYRPTAIAEPVSQWVSR
jgi:AcrR family transcriptional regulator